jgi:hypothetical protein
MHHFGISFVETLHGGVRMATRTQWQTREQSVLIRWLLKGKPEEVGPYEPEAEVHETHPWWKVMCLTGVDYFSSLAYQPSLGGQAALAATAGTLVAATTAQSPFAALVLVMITLFGALPMYRQVAVESSHGQGSLAILEDTLIHKDWGWKRIISMLLLISFVVLAFVYTITLSASDSIAHMVENPVLEHVVVGHEVLFTNILIGLLGVVFLFGFSEAIVIAVPLVIVYIGMSSWIGIVGIYQIILHPELVHSWTRSLNSIGSLPTIVVSTLLLFPKLALGLSGFETGNVVSPLVKGYEGDDPEQPVGRIRNTQKLLTSAARIMAVMLILSSFTTTLLIPAEAYIPVEHGADEQQLAQTIAEAEHLLKRPINAEVLGEANGRASAYLAHTYVGDGFGTMYDFVTLGILWFAGASAMAGLLNIVPRYLPRYGMAPSWAQAFRPLVLVFTFLSMIIAMVHRADVESQAGPYATGILVLFTVAALAIAWSAKRQGNKRHFIHFGIVFGILLYTFAVNFLERPIGAAIGIVMFVFILAISLISRIIRAFELRADGIEIGPNASAVIEQLTCEDHISIVCNKPPVNGGGTEEYLDLDIRTHKLQYIPENRKYITVEAVTVDPSVFRGMIKVVLGDVEYAGHHVFRCYGVAVPNTIAAVVKHINDVTNAEIHVNMEGTKGNPIRHAWEYLLYGLGDTGRVTAYILEKELNKLTKDNCGHVQIHVTYDIYSQNGHEIVAK